MFLKTVDNVFLFPFVINNSIESINFLIFLPLLSLEHVFFFIYLTLFLLKKKKKNLIDFLGYGSQYLLIKFTN